MNIKNKSRFIEYFSKGMKSQNNLISDIHCIHHEETPIQSAYSIAIAIDSLEVSHRNKAVICLIQKESVVSCLPTNWDDDTLRAESRTFGQYGVVIDSIAPTIKTKSHSDSNKNKYSTNNHSLSKTTHAS